MAAVLLANCKMSAEFLRDHYREYPLSGCELLLPCSALDTSQAASTIHSQPEPCRQQNLTTFPQASPNTTTQSLI
jgi:hypothetical protein